jgi:glycosyltransferase involved in cell wall biosynthesis
MPRLLHITTTDISLELLLGPQLSTFVAAGYDVHAASAPGPFVSAIEDRGVTFHALEHSTRAMSLTSDLKAGREVYQLIRKLQPDIVHTHNPKPGVYGRIAARMAKVPVVVNTVHGLYAQPDDKLAKKTAVYSLERLAAAFSHAELVQNVEDAATLRSLRVPADKLSVLGNGVDLARFQPATPQQRRTRRASLSLDDSDIFNTVNPPNPVTAIGARGHKQRFFSFDKYSV